MVNETIQVCALMGAETFGRASGERDSKIGATFRGAYQAADDASLTRRDPELRALRDMFVHGYLGALPKDGIKVDADGKVVG